MTSEENTFGHIPMMESMTTMYNTMRNWTSAMMPALGKMEPVNGGER